MLRNIGRYEASDGYFRDDDHNCLTIVEPINASYVDQRSYTHSTGRFQWDSIARLPVVAILPVEAAHFKRD